MKTLMALLFVVIMALTLVPNGEAGTVSSNDHPAVFAETHNVLTVPGERDSDRAGNVTAFPPYPCIAAPAYTDYIDAQAIPCSKNEKAKRVKEPMGAWQ